MNKLPKMSIGEYSIPVGEECPCPSKLEALNVVINNDLKGDNIDLMLFRTDEQSLIFWCSYNNDHTINAVFNLFKGDPSPQKLSNRARKISIGEYIRHGNDIYKICEDSALKQVVKQMWIYSTAIDAKAAYSLSDAAEDDDNPDEDPECYLVRITEVIKPNETLCYAWYVTKEDRIFLSPIFWEDAGILREKFINCLNWEFLHEGNIFRHNDRYYRICKDKDEDYYISPLKMTLQLCKVQ